MNIINIKILTTTKSFNMISRRKQVKQERAERRKQLKEEMTLPFRPIQHILQGINRRSRDQINNKQTQKKFNDLYNLLSNENQLIQAYGNIQRNKGSLTPGVNPETVDAMSMKKIQEITNEIKQGKFHFNRLRRKWITKPKLYKPGEQRKLRPLSVPTFKDRLVQEAIRMILESIYEPIFEKANVNMGFRPGKGCHHCIKKLKEQAPNCTMAIEGDIEGAYDNVDHSILIRILEKQISDQKFLKLLKQGFKCGILDNFKPSNTLTGVPQGGLASPILFNIYMHEFDKYIQNELNYEIDQINEQEKRSKKPRNPEYEQIQKKITSYRKALNQKKEIKNISNIMKQKKE